ncbi:MAG: hypothetical protein LBG94_09070, partial [Treponema sp.]|nr:hypothetical protein [Treponema sp.]
SDKKTAITSEVTELLHELMEITKTAASDFDFWDRTHTAKESFREKTRLGISGTDVVLTINEIRLILSAIKGKLLESLKKIENLSVNGVIPTCFAFTPDSYEINDNAYESMSASAKARAKPPAGDHQAGATEAMRAMMGEKTPSLIIRSFKRKDLPLFLEGPVHYLRLCPEKNIAENFHKSILSSPLYDKKLNMFKINAPIASAGQDIGRITVFTPGWLENESVWLHMEYKYLLELLRSGMAGEFYTIAKTALIPFLDPDVYGRSILENSSFIASSAHPEESFHGQGFVARLSGATAEFISMWIAITSGLKPFTLCEGELCFALKPCINESFFTENNTFSFNFLGSCKVVYHNDSRKNTYGPDGASVQSYRITFKDGAVLEVNEPVIKGEKARAIREGKAAKIDCCLR